jgi:hypothetical protein
MTLLACRITVHYLHWMNANPYLARDTRQYARATLCNRLLRLDFNPSYFQAERARLPSWDAPCLKLLV